MASLALLLGVGGAAAAGGGAAAGTIGTIGTIASLASTIVGVGGALLKGKAAGDAGEFQAAILEQQAASERDAAAAGAEDFRRRGSRARASSIARSAGSGVDPQSGSPLLVDEAFVKDIALGSARILQGGSVRSTRLGQQAGLSRFQGKKARTAGFIGAGTSLLSGLQGAIQ